MITTFNAVVNTTMPPSCHSVTARDQPFYQMQNKALAVFWVTVTGTAGASTYTEWQLSALVITTLWLAEAWPWQKFLRHFLPWIEFFKTSNFKSTRVHICLISEGKNGFIFNFFFVFVRDAWETGVARREEGTGEWQWWTWQVRRLGDRLGHQSNTGRNSVRGAQQGQSPPQVSSENGLKFPISTCSPNPKSPPLLGTQKMGLLGYPPCLSGRDQANPISDRWQPCHLGLRQTEMEGSCWPVLSSCRQSQL